MRAEIEIIRIRMHLPVVVRMLRRGRPNHRQARRLQERQETEQDRVDHTEDGAVRPDSEGKGENRNQGKAGRFYQLPQGVSEID